jgi:dihydroorotate dehydrogenase subfamily 2
MFSAAISTVLFVMTLTIYSSERKRVTMFVFHTTYTNLVKKIFFLFSAEKVHNLLVNFGEKFGSNRLSHIVVKFLFFEKHDSLRQSIHSIDFQTPIGLAAGFDYEARLAEVLPPWGFGFQTVGTITNHAYEGNPSPMLGRLPKSKSLMVNKGYKNLGAKETIRKLKGKHFTNAVGISIGRTNSRQLTTQKESVKDIVATFKAFESSKLKHAYYELNISCPNLYGDITFYPTKNLEELLTAVDAVKVKRPIFVKMPIEKTDSEVRSMLKVIVRHKIAGVIFGNLQKDRTNKAFVRSEVNKFAVGNFSGKPTFDRSNELISLAYSKYKNKLTIIGCGGVFSGSDAYEKIIRGASVVQLITGMIFEGPQLVSQINFDLEDLLRKNGFTHISEAIGTKSILT